MAKAKTIYEELTKPFNFQVEEGEDEQTHFTRLLKQHSDEEDDKLYDSLSAGAQKWINAGVLAVQSKKPIAECPGAPTFGEAEAEGEGEETGDAEETGEETGEGAEAGEEAE